MLTHVPSMFAPPNSPVDDLLNSLPVVAPLGFEIRRQVLAQHVGLHEPVATRRQETDRHD